jgi:hypothetical protein
MELPKKKGIDSAKNSNLMEQGRKTGYKLWLLT